MQSAADLDVYYKRAGLDLMITGIEFVNPGDGSRSLNSLNGLKHQGQILAAVELLRGTGGDVLVKSEALLPVS